MHDFVVALGLVFVLEGLVFAASPGLAKRAMQSIMQTPDGILRLIGLGSAVIGVILIWVIRG